MPLKRQTVRAARRRDEAAARAANETIAPPAPLRAPRCDGAWRLRMAAGAGPLGPLEHWFAENGWKAFDFQREVWNGYLEGASGLVHSATGSGKTLAAALGPMAEWMAEGSEPGTDPEPGSVPLRVLWITPMRALAADTRLSIERAADGLGIPWTVGLRTGDTSGAERTQQARRLPTVLVT